MIRSLQQSLFDPGVRETQTRELARVRDSIQECVIAWLKSRCEHNACEFYLWQLENHVYREMPSTTPGSAGRILRLLRRTGDVDYVVLRRRDSHYKITKLKGWV